MKPITTGIALSLLYFFVSSATANNDKPLAKTPDPNCPTEYFYRGYDYVKGNPATPGGDPGWRAQVMSPKRNDACLYCNAYTACANEYRSFEMTGEIDYYNRLLKNVSVSGGSDGFLKDVAFTGSAEFEYQRQDVFGVSLANIQAEGSCQIWEGLRVPGCPSVVFDSNFLIYMADFPISTDEPEWFNRVLAVFRLFGTHIVGDDMSLGARWTDESQMTTVSYEGLRSIGIDIDAAAEVSAEFFRTKEASGQYESEKETELRLAFDGATSKHRGIYLGDPPPSDLDYSTWVNNIKTPIPISFTVSPISELLTPKLFPDDPNIELKRAVMEAAYELYCDAVPGCGKPQPPSPPEPIKIVRLSNSVDGKYYRQNMVGVTCPENYHLVSGGCKTEPLPGEPNFWYLSSLKAIGNTYQCIANEDYGTSNFYRGVTAYATCLHKDWVKNIVTANCEGPTSQFGSACVATCPIGYKVIGGSCESNAPQEYSPWKVERSNPYFGSDAVEGWNCRVSEDFGSRTYYRKALGYAQCIQYPEEELQDSKLITEYSGTAGKFTNGSNVSCELGYDVLGGGCDAGGWKIIETQHTLDQRGWSCLGQEDVGTEAYNRDVRTDTLCVKFK